MYHATITTDEIREEFLAIRAGRTTLNDPEIMGTIARIRPESDGHPDSFTGCTGRDMEGWVLHGYNPVGALDVTVGGGEDAPRAELIYDDEEGDLMVDAVLSGEDEYRVRWEEIPAPRSIRIVAQVNMLAGTPAEVLGQYCDFILRAVDAAANCGGAPSLEIMHMVRGAIHGQLECRFFIPLVKSGEEIDPTAWRAFFSIGGFRILGFLGRAIAAKKDRKRLGAGMGHSTGPGWKVTAEGDSVTITCPPHAQNFPAEDMERQLREALA